MSAVPALDDEAQIGPDGSTITVETYAARLYFTRLVFTPDTRRACTRCDLTPTHRVRYAHYLTGELTCSAHGAHLKDVLGPRVLSVSPI